MIRSTLRNLICEKVLPAALQEETGLRTHGSPRRRTTLRCSRLALVLIALTSTSVHARRTILGRVTDSSGQPVAGLLVKAYDSDPGPDDFMGQALTDSYGDYRISFAGGHWDPFPHRITKWRPDIYVQVYVQARGQWVRVTQSGIRGDRPHRYDTTINVRVASNHPLERETAFDPVVYGFPFRNDKFTVCGAPTCREEHWAGQYLRDVLSFEWALCGGMSLTALRRFEAGREAEDFSPRLKEELVAAQIETVSLGVWAKFIQWQARPTRPHTFSLHTIGQSTKDEWWKFKRSIDAGRPMILGLIRIQSTNPFRASENHQVLGVGYRFNELTREVEIDAYDPNYPDATSTISMNIGLPDSQIEAAQHTPLYDAHDRTRGFFVIETPLERIASQLNPAPRIPRLKARQVFDGNGEAVKPTVPFRRGDVDGSGRVDIGDVVFQANYLAGGPAPGCLKSADANDDGELDAADLAALLSYLNTGGTTLPAPHRECGPDRTGDSLTCASYEPCQTDDE